MSKVVGILGGMGPYATMDFVHKILINTPAKVDQDHLRLLLYNNPKIPSRMEAFQPGKESPVKELIHTAKALEKGGADFIMMPCHSAHYWIEEIRQAISIPFFSMVECVAEFFLSEQNADKEVLLLATETTIQSGQYQSIFVNLPLSLFIPKSSEQKKINDGIRLIKANPYQTEMVVNDLNEILLKYKNMGVRQVIGGCTEIPLIRSQLDQDIQFIDPTLLLALKAIKIAAER
ncbi:aspartate/glutamate racemase family protein [Bacillus horti]|uniref:Aspartate racemase n=1 Tax=Caldalkalibacillus horti TaxID=77523 RepID=A0ABT9VWH6_9BACI|nr:amino acid racemase [Bacillus horti]MDQ0165346.1 aspartate racemase [Bacillus horti]